VASSDDLTAAAVRHTGLADFGDDSFREGLGLLLADLDSARLNARGEGFIYPRLVRYLEQRLHVEDWYLRHPEIEDIPVEAPLFGLGLPRTGSTALSCLLAQDPNVRYVRRWESSEPCPPSSTVVGDDPRVTEDERVLVGSRFHTPHNTHDPMECLDIMAMDFKSQIFQAFAAVPKYSEWLVSDADFTSTYRFEKRVLKLLQFGERPRPWRLKSPSHVLSLEALDSVFPDARFVMTHRDPTDVLLSVVELYADMVGGFSDVCDRRYLGRLNVEHWSVGMERAVKFRDGGAGHRFYDIDFRVMAADPIGEVRGLYTWLGEPVSAEFEQQMGSWWEHNAANREPSVRADPADFGLDLDAIRPLFADYVDHARRWTQRKG
jgi:hypothetical protein